MVGTLRDFDEARRFGFIAIDGGEALFVHQKEFDAAGLSPEPGARLRFRMMKDERGREYACELREL